MSSLDLFNSNCLLEGVKQSSRLESRLTTRTWNRFYTELDQKEQKQNPCHSHRIKTKTFLNGYYSSRRSAKYFIWSCKRSFHACLALDPLNFSEGMQTTRNQHKFKCCIDKNLLFINTNVSVRHGLKLEFINTDSLTLDGKQRQGWKAKRQG